MGSTDHIAEMESWIVEEEAERQQVAARLPLGTCVVEDLPEDRREPRVGVVVEPTADELVRGEDECCTFDPGRTWVLVEWSYPEDSGYGVEREWESPRQLAVAPL